MAKTTTRVARWRQRLREEGKAALTIWLPTEEKLRLEDLARTWRTSPSALVQQALAQFQPTRTPSLPSDTDTSQVRLLIRDVLREELPGMVQEVVAETATVTDTSAETVAATSSAALVTDAVAEAVAAMLARDLPALVRQLVEAMALEARGASVTDTRSNVTVTAVSGERPAAAALAASAMEEVPAYDTSKHVLGKLCPRGHDYHGTGKSLLRVGNHGCLACEAEKARQRRKAKRKP